MPEAETTIAELPTTKRTGWWATSSFAQRLKGSPGLVVAYLISRVILILIPLGYFPYFSDGTVVVNDIDLYAHWAQVLSSGHFPIGDPMWQYPPLAGTLFLVINLMPSHPVVIWELTAFACDLVIFLIFWLSGRKRKRLQAGWCWVLAALLLGPFYFARFDVFPTLFAILGVMAAAKPVRNGFLSGFWFAIGALMKIWPGFLIFSIPRRYFWKCAWTFVFFSVVIAVLLSRLGGDSWAFLKSQGGRGLQVESVGAIGYWIQNFFHPGIPTIYRFGSIEVDIASAGHIATLITLFGFFLIGVIAVARYRGRLENATTADVAFVIIVVSVCFNRVLSPQYMIWVAGLFCVCMLDVNSRMRLAGFFLALSTAFGQAVYPTWYADWLAGGLIGTGCQLLRIVFLLVGTVIAWKALFYPRAQMSAPGLPRFEIAARDWFLK